MTTTAAGTTRRARIRALFFLISAALILTPPHASAQKRKPRTAPKPAAASSSKTITVATEPNAVVWLDEVRRGAADEQGQLELKTVPPTRHSLRVRAAGFGERVVQLLPTQRGRVEVKLAPTTDEAELAFQRAEEAREKATAESRKSAVELYRRALTLRPRYPAAHVGLARALSELGEFEAALEQIEEARRDRAIYPEASAVEGRILHSSGDDAAALGSYARAIREARGFQPEAHTGTGVILQERGDYAGAAAAFRKAVAQLSDTEPVLYQLLGEALEKQEKYKEAVAAYEKYLALAPQGKLAPAIESIIDQLRKQAAEQESPPPSE
ncbi:MAG: tetratricopeptide repeat protein [Acidobacteria bacterium]|nr:tetratricopeptide repeat protein [Acidobacteriota bacterium]MCA1642568.1 tetratricopeptide repeat protein [Acidobacteriota bacterium]